MSRAWLHPRWYVSASGPWRFEGAYPHSPIISVDHSEPRPCVQCGIDCMEVYGCATTYERGILCPDCRDAELATEPPPEQPSLLRVVAWKADSQVDRFYWWYCERFGKRVYEKS